MQEEHHTTDHGKKIILKGEQAGEGGDVWKDRRRIEERKNVQKMVGRHQRVGQRGNSHTQQSNGWMDGIGFGGQ